MACKMRHDWLFFTRVLKSQSRPVTVEAHFKFM